MIVALDSFDTPHSGCTTLTATLLMLELYTRGFELKGYPRLVRLNPSVPWKTRGNAAIAFEVEGEMEEVFKISKEFLEKAPGRGALLVTDKRPPEEYYYKAVERVVDPKDLEVEGLWWGKEGALVGAVAAAAARDLPNFELLAYRLPENLGKPRKCSFHPLYEALYEVLYPLVHESSPEVVCPRGPDPVLLGIRGTHPPSMVALLKLFTGEPFSLVTIFRTNQHSYSPKLPTSLYPYDYTSLEYEGKAEVKGEDVYFSDNVLYKETGITRLFKLMRGWKNKFKGKLHLSVKPGVKNVTALEVERLVFWKYSSPRCPKCGGPMVSKGRGLLRKCKKCGYEEERPRRVRLQWLEDQKLYPVEGRKLHLEGSYAGTWDWEPKHFCEEISWECATLILARGRS